MDVQKYLARTLSTNQARVDALPPWSPPVHGPCTINFFVDGELDESKWERGILCDEKTGEFISDWIRPR